MRVRVAEEILETGQLPEQSGDTMDPMQADLSPLTGQARSARNAFKHGLRAKKYVMSDEDAEAFQEYRIELMNELRPVGTLETAYASRIAQELWRIQRCMTIEADLFDHECEGIGEQRYSLGEVFARGSKGLTLLIRYQTAIDRCLERAVRTLARLQRGRREDESGTGEAWLGDREFPMPERLRGWTRAQAEEMIRDGINPFQHQREAAIGGQIPKREMEPSASRTQAAPHRVMQEPASASGAENAADTASGAMAEGDGNTDVESAAKDRGWDKRGQLSKRTAPLDPEPAADLGKRRANAHDGAPATRKKHRRGRERR